jgi:hypothetical protein
VIKNVVDGEDFQIWCVALNIMNKQLQMNNKGYSPSLRLGLELNNFLS